MKIDILGIVAHPDDAELSFGGTLLVHQKKGYRTGVIDLTRGELSTRGTPKIRLKETQSASKTLQLTVRENLDLADGFFENNKENQLKIIKQIRKYCPKIVITNALYERHPDHQRAAELVETSCFLSGLKKIETTLDNQKQKVHRPEKLFFCIQSVTQEPDLLVDISKVINERRNAISAYQSQIYNPTLSEPSTYISSKSFMDMLESRSREWGHRINVSYAEGFKIKHFIGIRDFFDLL